MKTLSGAWQMPAPTWPIPACLCATPVLITGAMPLTNITQGAISFHASTLEAGWPGMVQTVTIGHNVFYRRPGKPSSS